MAKLAVFVNLDCGHKTVLTPGEEFRWQKGIDNTAKCTECDRYCRIGEEVAHLDEKATELKRGTVVKIHHLFEDKVLGEILILERKHDKVAYYTVGDEKSKVWIVDEKDARHYLDNGMWKVDRKISLKKGRKSQLIDEALKEAGFKLD